MKGLGTAGLGNTNIALGQTLCLRSGKVHKVELLIHIASYMTDMLFSTFDKDHVSSSLSYRR